MYKKDIIIPLKTSVDVARIRRSCRVIEKTFRKLSQYIEPGITTKQLDLIAENIIYKNNAVPTMKGYKGFPGSICTSVNNVVAHGVPSEYKLINGDIITIDIIVSIDGWHGDGAWTFLVGDAVSETKKIVRAAWQANLRGLMAIYSGNHIGDIGYSINNTAIKYGYSVVQEYVGHGIGQEVHEDPRIPNIGKKGMGDKIVPGMVFTVEPILNEGKPDVRVLEDNWTIITKDGGLSAQFEHTVAVFKDRIEILTISLGNIKEYIDYPPLFS